MFCDRLVARLYRIQTDESGRSQEAICNQVHGHGFSDVYFESLAMNLDRSLTPANDSVLFITETKMDYA